MGWCDIKTDNNYTPKIDIIRDGINAVDARIYFGKFCVDNSIGVLLSEIINNKGGKGYIRWLRDDFPKGGDELSEACDEILSRY
jgi:hypothetical protein